jgi:hypothetical protein
MLTKGMEADMTAIHSFIYAYLTVGAALALFCLCMHRYRGELGLPRITLAGIASAFLVSVFIWPVIIALASSDRGRP